VDERLFQATALLALRPELSSCTSSSRSALPRVVTRIVSVATSQSRVVSRLREREREREREKQGTVSQDSKIDRSNDFAVSVSTLEIIRENSRKRVPGDTHSGKRSKSLSRVTVTVSVNG